MMIVVFGLMPSGLEKKSIISLGPIGGDSLDGTGRHSYSNPFGGTRSGGGMQTQGLFGSQMSS
jgi:hypothetical protein